MSRIRSLYSKLKSTSKDSDLAKINIKHHKFTWTTQFFCQLAALTAILAALGLGTSSTIFSLKTRHLFGHAVDSDLQLALIGLINKIMDLLLTTALQSTAGVIITLWMTRRVDSEGEAGVRLADLELSDELTKPWTAISKFAARCRHRGWRASSGLRFIVTLSISTCVILQSLAVNTIGVPKKRWLPEPVDARNVSHPLSDLKNIDWMNFWGSSWGTVGGGDVSWDVAAGYVASSTNLAFRDFASIMDQHPRGWQELSRDNTDAFTALDIQRNGSSARGFAVHTNQAVDILTWMQNSGISVARHSIGISAELKFTVPGTVVSCQSPSGSSSLNFTDASVVVEIPTEGQNSKADFLIHLNSTSSVESSDVTCEVHFHRMLFPVSTWIIDGDLEAAASVNKWWKQYDIDPEIMPHTSVDARMAASLANQVDVTTKRLERLSPAMSTSQWLMSIAREVRRRRPEYASDTEALAPTIAFLTNYLLTIANWDIAFSETDQVESENVRWEVYGSGPRLQWEWCIATVFGILALSLGGCMVLSVCKMVVPGEWLTPAGMLVAANCSGSIVEVRDAVREQHGNIEDIRIRVAQVGEKHTATLAVARYGEGIDRSKTYRWA